MASKQKRKGGEPSAMTDGVKYYHWAEEPVRLRKRKYLQSGHPKPNGLWFDVNEEWRRWCEADQFRLETLRYRHMVTILDSSRILFLRRARDIDAFTRKYGRNLTGRIQFLQSTEDLDAFTSKFGHDLIGDIQRQFSQYIMWDEVAEKHSGIIIVPYSPSRSLSTIWYYGWHCASGCVWDTSIIRLGKPCRVAPESGNAGQQASSGRTGGFGHS